MTVVILGSRPGGGWEGVGMSTSCQGQPFLSRQAGNSVGGSRVGTLAGEHGGGAVFVLVEHSFAFILVSEGSMRSQQVYNEGLRS